jgi:hypothetical protein
VTAAASSGESPYPILALTILPLDIIAIYGLLAYGGRRRSVRGARARAQAGGAS